MYDLEELKMLTATVMIYLYMYLWTAYLSSLIARKYEGVFKPIYE